MTVNILHMKSLNIQLCKTGISIFFLSLRLKLLKSKENDKKNVILIIITQKYSLLCNE